METIPFSYEGYIIINDMSFYINIKSRDEYKKLFGINEDIDVYKDKEYYLYIDNKLKIVYFTYGVQTPDLISLYGYELLTKQEVIYTSKPTDITLITTLEDIYPPSMSLSVIEYINGLLKGDYTQEPPQVDEYSVESFIFIKEDIKDLYVRYDKRLEFIPNGPYYLLDINQPYKVKEVKILSIYNEVIDKELHTFIQYQVDEECSIWSIKDKDKYLIPISYIGQSIDLSSYETIFKYPLNEESRVRKTYEYPFKYQLLNPIPLYFEAWIEKGNVLKKIEDKEEYISISDVIDKSRRVNELYLNAFYYTMITSSTPRITAIRLNKGVVKPNERNELTTYIYANEVVNGNELCIEIDKVESDIDTLLSINTQLRFYIINRLINQDNPSYFVFKSLSLVNSFIYKKTFYEGSSRYWEINTNELNEYIPHLNISTCPLINCRFDLSISNTDELLTIKEGLGHISRLDTDLQVNMKLKEVKVNTLKDVMFIKELYGKSIQDRRVEYIPEGPYYLVNKNGVYGIKVNQIYSYIESDSNGDIYIYTCIYHSNNKEWFSYMTDEYILPISHIHQVINPISLSDIYKHPYGSSLNIMSYDYPFKYIYPEIRYID